MPNITINKIHLKSENVMIAYEELDDRGSRDVTINWKHKPNKEFQDAMKALAEHVIDISEFPDEWLDQIQVRGVSFSYQEERGTMGAVISATRTLEHSNSPLNISTPIKMEHDGEAELQGDSMIFLTSQCVKALHTVRDCAEDYLNGMHAADNQADMFADPKDAKNIIDSHTPDTILNGRRSPSAETERVFGMKKALPNDHESGLDVKKVSKKAPHKK